MLCYALLCFAMLCYALLCFAMLCYALLCFAVLCYAAMLCCALFGPQAECILPSRSSDRSSRSCSGFPMQILPPTWSRPIPHPTEHSSRARYLARWLPNVLCIEGQNECIKSLVHSPLTQWKLKGFEAESTETYPAGKQESKSRWSRVQRVQEGIHKIHKPLARCRPDLQVILEDNRRNSTSGMCHQQRPYACTTKMQIEDWCIFVW